MEKYKTAVNETVMRIYEPLRLTDYVTFSCSCGSQSMWRLFLIPHSPLSRHSWYVGYF